MKLHDYAAPRAPFRSRAPWALTVLALAGCMGAPPEADEVLVGSAQSPLSILSTKMWRPPVGVTKIRVNTCFVGGTTTQRNFVRNNAEQSWEGIASRRGDTNYGVDFLGWGTCPAATTKVLRIAFSATADTSVTHGLGIDSVAGTNRTTPGLTFLTDSTQVIGPNGASTVIHEFGHVLGFTHEFNRTDYAEVDPDCTASGGSVPDLGLTSDADTGSIMNYPSCGRTGTLTNLDEFGFISVYGPWTFQGGFLSLPMSLRRESNGRFVRVALGSIIPYADGTAITANTDMQIVSLESNGLISFGGRVALLVPNGQRLIQNSSNSVSTSISTGATTEWRVRGRQISGPVHVNDEVMFESSTGRFLSADSTNRLSTIVSGEFWRMTGHLNEHF